MRRALLLLLISAPALADDELEVKWRGRVQSDLQLRIEDKALGDFYDRHELPAGAERVQAMLGMTIDAKYGKWRGLAQLEIVTNGFATPLAGIEDLSRTEALDPVRIEARELYVEAKDLFTDGLDLRLGQQIVSWGVGDQFNPTNNLNPDDLRDRLLFGRQAGNFMARADYWIGEDVVFSGVVVPLFKPAVLPPSAPLGTAAVDRLPFVSDPLRWRIAAENAAAGILGAPTVVAGARPVLPRATFANMPFSLRAAATLAEQDLAISYYRGRTDFPVPRANHTRFDAGEAQCDPDDPMRCVVGLLETEVELWFPRMQVFGLNAAGEIPLSWISSDLHGLGYRFEAALVVPRRATIRLTNDALALPTMPQPAGEYDYDNDGVPGGPRPAVVEDTPFAKWVVGLDYTFGPRWYVNAQWVHGMPDEHGAGDFLSDGRAVRASGVSTDAFTTLVGCAQPRDGTRCAREVYRPRIADYLVVGVDLKLLNNALLTRLFTIVDLSGISVETWDDAAGERVSRHRSPFSGEGHSIVIYPELAYNLGNGLELGAGALLQLGKSHSKFGDPAAGGSLAWTRARFSF